MFTLDRKTGQLYVKEENLDRETIDFYKLVVEGTDMGGGSGGLVGTGTVEVKVLDINDNIPTWKNLSLGRVSLSTVYSSRTGF
ncbi:hypothetical protein F7725_023369 [Dissostichus mawsoni]|uniref:Cadherin domain-containing protein n=1 Tax=Dissostichus mawsoni TaxID=36200 RepID=A0A7J5Z0H9_DISMA|nr:hypothetical protein F7725_023369 [Dissostichus mawsoni]